MSRIMGSTYPTCSKNKIWFSGACVRDDFKKSLKSAAMGVGGTLGCPTKTCFSKKKWLNPLHKYLGAALKESKRIFDFDKF